MTTLEINCNLDVLERWQNLSEEAKHIILNQPQGLDFARMMWEKQFYKEVAELYVTE